MTITHTYTHTHTYRSRDGFDAMFQYQNTDNKEIRFDNEIDIFFCKDFKDQIQSSQYTTAINREPVCITRLHMFNLWCHVTRTPTRRCQCTTLATLPRTIHDSQSISFETDAITYIIIMC